MSAPGAATRDRIGVRPLDSDPLAVDRSNGDLPLAAVEPKGHVDSAGVVTERGSALSNLDSMAIRGRSVTPSRRESDESEPLVESTD